jgi:hypothetical protein
MQKNADITLIAIAPRGGGPCIVTFSFAALIS